MGGGGNSPPLLTKLFMVDRYTNKYFSNLFFFVKINKNSDFYYTEKNIRKFVSQEKDLKIFLRMLNNIFVYSQSQEIKGVISTWCSDYSGVRRIFVKIDALDAYVAEKMLTCLLWNTKIDLYFKVKKKYSKIIDVFKSKGFRFCGDRGREILLFKKYIGKDTKNKIRNP